MSETLPTSEDIISSGEFDLTRMQEHLKEHLGNLALNDAAEVDGE